MSNEARQIFEACVRTYCALRFHATPCDRIMLDVYRAFAKELPTVSAMDLLMALQERDARFQLKHVCSVSPMHSRERMDDTLHRSKTLQQEDRRPPSRVVARSALLPPIEREVRQTDHAPSEAAQGQLPV
ncbi:hypothetical protein CYMTET_47303 [Cymbomonas tetramitiformis]|uniref:Uncharacterized protein n=1 Tax=Cymbomonas tetramitiformis TaxID=36881 RepID=A0AAE0BW08_9CHLO|nr:hypothetical protein CYMTET_47303 [Cymbomonas tetramitiformis]